MIEKQGRDTIIVVEDVDRSGEFGLRFLETLRDFLHGLKTDHKCLVIAPIGDSEFDKNQPVYHKCIDYFDRFRLRKLKLETFVDRVFKPDLFDDECKDHNNKVQWTGVHRRGQVCSFLEILLNPRAQISMRTIKTILRNANLTFAQQVDDGFEPDFRATIGFEASKYIMVGTEPKSTLFEQFRESRSVGRNTWLGVLLYSMALDRPSILVRSGAGNKLEPATPPVDIKLVEHTGKHGHLELIPWHWTNEWAHAEEGEAKQGISLSDFYLDY